VKILILGATGRTGRLVLEIALARGYQVNCLVRDPEKLSISSDLIAIFEGNPANSHDLKLAIEGCDAVISVLNISRNSDFPWARLRTPATFLSEVMSQLVQIATKLKVNRIVVCSAWGVGTTGNDIPIWFKWLINNSNIGVAYQDHEKQEAIVRQSQLMWTIVRPVGLTNAKGLQKPIVSLDNRPIPRLTVSRKCLATFMIDTLLNDALASQAITLSGK